MNDVLDFNIKLNGELCALPFVTCWLTIIVSAVISDKIIGKKRFSKKLVRKAFNTIGFLVPILTFIGICFVLKSTRVIGFFLILLNLTFR